MPEQTTTNLTDDCQLAVESDSGKLIGFVEKRVSPENPSAISDDAGYGPSIIGSTLVMKGELTLDEDLIVDGTFIGPTINGVHRLSVSTFAKVHADVQSASAEIAGTVEGEVNCGSDLMLRRTAHLRGSLAAEDVVVEQGTNLENAVLTGRITCAPKRKRR